MMDDKRWKQNIGMRTTKAFELGVEWQVYDLHNTRDHGPLVLWSDICKTEDEAMQHGMIKLRRYLDKLIRWQ